MKHERHVKHLLIRFVTGQMNPRSLARVRAHVATCRDCRTALALQEDLLSELRQGLFRLEPPAPEHASNWWNVIQLRQLAQPKRLLQSVTVSLFAPAVLSLLLLAGVLAAEAGSAHAAVSATFGGPAIDTTLEPTNRASSKSDSQPLRPAATATPDIGASSLTIPAAPSPFQTD